MNTVCWRHRHLDNCLIAYPYGVLDALSYRDFRDKLIKFAVDQPRAVIVITDQLRCTVSSALLAFSSAAMRVSDWPGVPVVVVAGRADQRAMFDSTQVSRFVPVFAEFTPALAVARKPPRWRKADLQLDRHVLSPRRARLFVRTICTHWQVAEQLANAQRIATELVENALLHTESAPLLRLQLRPGLLSVAVGDDSQREAVLHERFGADWTGLGLRIVADCAKAWGCVPQLAGGKVVWAVLPTADSPVGLG